MTSALVVVVLLLAFLNRRAGCGFAADLHRMAHLLAWHGAASVRTCALFPDHTRKGPAAFAAAMIGAEQKIRCSPGLSASAVTFGRPTRRCSSPMSQCAGRRAGVVQVQPQSTSAGEWRKKEDAPQ
jgi:hypothetical protein